jgi:hypothetical protein
LTELEKVIPWPAQAALCVCLALFGCTEFPEVVANEGPAGPPAELQPLDGLLPEGPGSDDPAPALKARAARLKARAAIGAP